MLIFSPDDDGPIVHHHACVAVCRVGIAHAVPGEQVLVVHHDHSQAGLECDAAVDIDWCWILDNGDNSSGPGQVQAGLVWIYPPIFYPS